MLNLSTTTAGRKNIKINKYRCLKCGPMWDAVSPPECSSCITLYITINPAWLFPHQTCSWNYIHRLALYSVSQFLRTLVCMLYVNWGDLSSSITTVTFTAGLTGTRSNNKFIYSPTLLQFILSKFNFSIVSFLDILYWKTFPICHLSLSGINCGFY